jgi:hypothetical protein
MTAGDLKQSSPKQGVELGPLEWSGKFAGGIRADIRRRAPLYISDWTDAFASENLVKTSSSTMFLFFACISPAIAFGLLFQEGCAGSFGVVEMIMSSSIAGIIWAIAGGQPLCILGATGPVLAYTVVIYNLYGALVGEEYFMALYFWTGAWFSLFTVLLAASDMCCIVKHVTKFTEEIFSGLISAIFIVEAIKPTIKNFIDPEVENDSAFLQAFLMFGTFMLATKLAALKNTNLFTPMVRKLLGNFGVTIAILSMTGAAAIWARPGLDYGAIKISFLNVPSEIQPTLVEDNGEARGWIVNPFGPDGNLPMWSIFFTILPAAGFAVLGFLDQNLTTLLVNRKANNLKKPPAYHQDMLVCGLFIYPICSVFGLPFPVAATVRSLTHLISLTNYRMVPIEGGAIRKIPEKVVEQRATNFGIHLLIGLSLVMAFVLKFVPKSVLLGVFLFMGVSSLNGNELFERMALWPIGDSTKYPKYDYVAKVASARIHKFTVLQFICLVILYALKSFKEVAVVFPFFIAALVPIRRCFERMFTPEELEALDGHGEGEDEEEDISPIEELEQPPPVRVHSGVSKSSKGSKVDSTVPVVPSQDFAPLALTV